MPRRLGLLAAAGAALLAAAAVATAGPPPAVEAASILVGNGANGVVLLAESDTERLPIASITKVMTALIVLEHARPSDVVRVGGPAPTIGESSIGLRAGERLTVRELLTALLVQSANDAAYALAWHVGDGSVSRFVALMNEKAAELGLRDTHFSRPDGLDAPGNHSSARDLFKLARVAMRKPLIRRIVRIEETTVAGRTLVNRNDLLFSYPGTIGVKTGHTGDAGWSEVAAARRDGITIYAVLLGGPSRAERNADLAELLDWGFDQYRRVAIVRSGVDVRGGARSVQRGPARARRDRARGRDRPAGASSRRAGGRARDGRAARRGGPGARRDPDPRRRQGSRHEAARRGRVARRARRRRARALVR